MKTGNEYRINFCREIQDRLVRIQLEPETPPLSPEQKRHVTECGECRKFQTALLQLQKSMDINHLSGLQLNPGIRRQLRRKIRTVAAKSSSGKTRFFDMVWQVFQYRVPVYQVLIAALGLLLIFSFLNPVQLPPENKTVAEIPAVPADSVVYQRYQAFIRTNIRTADKSGRNLQEDSLLVRYTVSSL